MPTPRSTPTSPAGGPSPPRSAPRRRHASTPARHSSRGHAPARPDSSCRRQRPSSTPAPACRSSPTHTPPRTRRAQRRHRATPRSPQPKRSACPQNSRGLVSLAGEFHDLGKTDPRFQRWLNPRWEPGDELMAKSHTPRWAAASPAARRLSPPAADTKNCPAGSPRRGSTTPTTTSPTTTPTCSNTSSPPTTAEPGPYSQASQTNSPPTPNSDTTSTASPSRHPHRSRRRTGLSPARFARLNRHWNHGDSPRSKRWSAKPTGNPPKPPTPTP